MPKLSQVDQARKEMREMLGAHFRVVDVLLPEEEQIQTALNFFDQACIRGKWQKEVSENQVKLECTYGKYQYTLVAKGDPVRLENAPSKCFYDICMIEKYPKSNEPLIFNEDSTAAEARFKWVYKKHFGIDLTIPDLDTIF